MIDARSFSLIPRRSRKLADRVAAAEAELAQARQDAEDRRREREFLSGVEVAESDFGEWQDTVAAFNER
jgi:hypothetical protein